MTPAAAKEYYRSARALGLCGRCKQRDALPRMAYCSGCRTAIQAYNHQRQGKPGKRKAYVTKFTRAMRTAIFLRGPSRAG